MKCKSSMWVELAKLCLGWMPFAMHECSSFQSEFYTSLIHIRGGCLGSMVTEQCQTINYTCRIHTHAHNIPSWSKVLPSERAWPKYVLLYNSSIVCFVIHKCTIDQFWNYAVWVTEHVRKCHYICIYWQHCWHYMYMVNTGRCPHSSKCQRVF